MDTAALTLRINTEGMDTAQRGLQGLESAASMVESTVRKMVAAFALFKAGQFLGDMTQLTARYDTLGVVMKVVGNNAGYTSTQMEAYAQSLQTTGISMLESRNTLSMMASAHIDLANATKLGRIAQDAAVIGNINSSEAFQRMIYGLQSGQVEILRTIGLNVNFEQSYKKLALQLKKNAADLTETEKVQARVNAVMGKGADIAGAYEESLGTVGKAAKSMERIWENLQVILGKVFQSSFTVVIDAMTSAMKSATEWAEKNAKALDELGGSLRSVMSAGVEFTKLLGQIGGGAEGASEGVGFLTRLFQGISLIIAGATDALRAFWGELSGYVGFMVQKVGWLADKFTTMLGYTGEGGITRFGKGVESYGQGILNPLGQGTAVGRTLDGMLSSHGGKTSSIAEESARIAAAAAAKAKADKEAAEAASKAAAAAFVKVKEYGVNDHQYFSLDESDRNIPDLTPATVGALDLQMAMLKAQREARNLRLAVVTNWDIISQVIEDSSQNATDALVSWMNNLDGVGRSWDTLGQTVRRVIADMLIQMQRMIIQQQVMGPLMQWASNGQNWVSLFGGGGANVGPDAGTGISTGMNYPGTSIQSSGRVEPTIVVNVSSTGATDTKATGEGAAELGRMVNAACDQWAVKNMRAGGLLARA